MGSPLGPTLTNAFLYHFESQWLSDCSQAFCPSIYRENENAIFITFNSPGQLKLSNMYIAVPFRSWMSRYVVKIIN